MKIRNESKRTYQFNGGSIAPNEVVDIQDEAIAKALVMNYPLELICLDTIEPRVIEAKKDEAKEISLDEAKKDEAFKLAQAKPAKVKVKVN